MSDQTKQRVSGVVLENLIRMINDLSPVAEALRDLRDLRATLPKTKDGVTAYPGMKLYVQTDDSDPVVQEDQAILRVAYFDANEIRDAYANRAAAEAALAVKSA